MSVTVASWASRAQAREVWPDAPTEDAILDRLLEAASDQCQHYAPALAEDAVIPGRYMEATVLQARELWGATRREGDLIGFESYAVRARPLTSTVRALLRPVKGRRRVG